MPDMILPLYLTYLFITVDCTVFLLRFFAAFATVLRLSVGLSVCLSSVAVCLYRMYCA